MLCELHIKNVAVIDEITIDFYHGFNVLTGETGAGKSILIDAINMAMGGRANKDLIRNGTEYALADAAFSINEKIRPLLEELGVEAEEDLLVLSRQIGMDGKSRCRINGRLVPLNILRELGQALLTIHGQHDNQALFVPKTHLHFVDEYGNLQESLQRYQKVYSAYQEATERLASLSFNEGEKARKMDLLSFQIGEITEAKLRDGEEEELEERRIFLNNAETIAENVHAAYGSLYGSEEEGFSSYDLLQNAVRNLERVTNFDEKLSGFYDRLSSVLADMEDVTYDLKSYMEGIDFEPGELDRIEERLHQLFGLKRKYGNSVGEILAYLEKAEEERRAIEQNEELLVQVNREIAELKEQLVKEAESLTKERRIAAHKLEGAIMQELADLDMQKMRFSVRIEDRTDGEGDIVYGTSGADQIEFLISGNPGEALKPLSKIASGGEMSRIMLAMKSVLSDINAPDTMIFDEIDTGVSGRAAQKIAEKICRLAQKKQILCITHLAQIAGMADHHYCIEKHVDEERTVTFVTELSDDERKMELARIIGGVKVTELTLKAAQEMLEMAEKMKKESAL